MALSVSKADILSFNPCPSQTRDNLDTLMEGNERIDVEFILNVGVPADHKLWLILRPELLPIETLEKIRAAFVALVPTDNEWYVTIDTIEWCGMPSKMYRALQPQSNETTAAQLLTIVRGYLA